MLLQVGREWHICEWHGKGLATLQDSGKWSVWLKDVRNASSNTVACYMKAMDRFWVWSLYNPPEHEETFPSYLARYRRALLDGFVITEKKIAEEDGEQEEVEVPILACKPLVRKTVNKEIAGIESYFFFAEEHDYLYDTRFLNYQYDRYKSSRGALAGVQIRKSDLAMEAAGEFRKLLRPLKTPETRTEDAYLPIGAFDRLLEIAKPRERLIYILCGAASARIGQALNLTLYDIDYEKREVWLINPKSDDRSDIYGNKRRIWLKEEYGIDIIGVSEHNTPDLQFKYPIPLYHEPLYFINKEKYLSLFFETLEEYRNSKTFLPESARFPRHPFLFVTKSGRRLHQRETLVRFTRHLITLKQEGLLENTEGLGLHSLRHMYGHIMAEMHAKTGGDALIHMTQRAMGHRSLESTMRYFRISRQTIEDEIRKHSVSVLSKTKEGEQDVEEG